MRTKYKILIMTASAIALLAVSQHAFAGDESLRNERALIERPNAAAPFSRPTRPGGNGATNVFNKAQKGGLGGVGSASKGNAGAGILKGTGISGSITPSGVLGKAQQGAGSIKGGQGQAQGREGREGASVRQTESMQKLLGGAAGARGEAKGVGGKERVSARQMPGMKEAIGTAKNSRGSVAGVNKKDSGVHLTPEQQKAFKDSIRNPAVNHDKKDEIEKAKHVFDFAKPKEPKPIVFPPDKIVVPKPPKH